MTRVGGSGTQVGRHPTADEYREAVRDLTALEGSRVQLVQRLERMAVAIALTLDAEAAAEERLARIEELTGVHRINNRPAVEWNVLAQRYRSLLHAIVSIDELHPGSPGTLP
jgi:excinuclease UvrABC nuclease subunit